MKHLPTAMLLVTIVCLSFISVEAGMTCSPILGITITCPLPLMDDSKAFCCYDKNDIPACCNFPDYVTNNAAVLGGFIVGALILLLLCTLCCCCFCSCCLLAKRRQQGRVLYGPVVAVPVAGPNQPIYPAYPLQPTVHGPPPAYPVDPNLAYNPHYAQAR